MKLSRNQIDGLQLIGIGGTAAGLSFYVPGIGQIILAIDAVMLMLLGVNQGFQKEK
jgi:hypothetical protein